MAQRPEFLEFRIDGSTLGALRWPGLIGTPTIVAAHGITSNAWAWDPVAHQLAGAVELVALDLRGRGRSFGAPGPFGIRQHADDVAAVIAQLGAPTPIVGHSMGAFVALMAAERHPDLVSDVLLIDGGTAIPRPNGPDVDLDAVLDSTLGPGIERITKTWPNRVSYQAMWASHPAFVDGISPDLERSLLAELVDVDGGFRVAVSETAVRQDGRDLLADEEVRTLLDRRTERTTIVRAEFGMFGEPPGLVTPEARDRSPQHRWVEAAGLNHYTVINSSNGAALVADVIRQSLAH
ncbi:MAG TPA: alpha/beta hydrolase [Ilumatobacteraceae bacterium]|nr:alpha/beta hydrolase [Ilumatobacteraceae bacterium]